jgi:PBP1b-binding outer membrane lipoprotein LpoB
MEGVRIAFFGFSLFIFLLFGCSSQPAPVQTSSPAAARPQAQPATAASTNLLTGRIDTVLREGSIYIGSRIQPNSKIGVVNMQSQSANLSNYIIDSIIMHLVNSDRFIVVERSELANIQREQQYQLSGEVSDETAISIGHQLGVQYIITGSVLPLGNNHSLSLKITDVQTAQIMGTRIYTITPDNVLLSLVTPPANRPETPADPAAPQQVIMGDVNITNNTTTTIHGDVFVNMPEGFRR